MKFNTYFYTPLIYCLIILFGVLTLFYSGWFFTGIILSVISLIFIQNRSLNIDHYCVAVDLDTNNNGDVIEVSIHSFDKLKKQYRLIVTYSKQLNIFVDVRLLDTFYENIGYPIFEDLDYSLRKVDNSTVLTMKQAKQIYRDLIKSINQGYSYCAGSMQDRNLQQPVLKSVKASAGTKLWNWWTFKTSN